MSNAIVPFEQQMTLATAFARSGLFGVKTQEQALALMALCEAEGLHPAVAVRDYHIIQGRPALKADAMLARFQAAGGRVQWHDMSDTKVSATFSHPQGGEVRIEWTKEMVTRAQIKNDMHQKYPRQMLRARVISEGIRTVFPGVVAGVYSEVEAADMPQQREPRQPRDMGPADVMPQLADVLKTIKAAKSLDELEAARPDIRKLQGDEKKEALAAAKKRGEELRASANLTPEDEGQPLEGEVLPPEGAQAGDDPV